MSDDVEKCMKDLALSQKKPRSFSDFPIEVVELIIVALCFTERLILRNVCQSLRSLVDKQKPLFSTISMRVESHHVLCEYDNQKVIYANESYEGHQSVAKYPDAVKCYDIGYERLAFDDLESILSNPKLELECFTFDILPQSSKREWIERIYDRMEAFLKKLKRRVHTKKCDFQVINPSHLLSILPYTKPGVLETIMIRRDERPGMMSWSDELAIENIKKFTSLQQWKQAEELGVDCLFMNFPLEYATNFKRFNLKLHIVRADIFSRLREFFTNLSSFEMCVVKAQNYSANGWTRGLIGPAAPRNELTERVCHWTIPGSQDYLEVSLLEEFITIEKKKR